MTTQNPIPAQAFAKGPSGQMYQIRCDDNGNLYVTPQVTGNSFYVNETTGSDTTGTGAPNKPFASLGAALAAATDNNGDTIYLLGTCHVSDTLTWNKNVNLVGINGPSENDRARISQTGSSVFSPLVDWQASGVSVKNIATFHGFDDASDQICWNATTGGRCLYQVVEFLGMGNATAAAQAGSRSIVVGGDGENLFENCVFGLDTVVRATNANATMEIVGGSPRNRIIGGLFQSYVTDASDVHIKVASGGMDRYLILDGVGLHNFGTAMNAAITNAGGSPGGNVVLSPTSWSVGATAIATTGNVYVSGAVPTANTSSIGILAT